MDFPERDFPVIDFPMKTVRMYPAGRRASHRHPTSIPRKAPTEFRRPPGCWPSANWDCAPAIWQSPARSRRVDALAAHCAARDPRLASFDFGTPRASVRSRSGTAASHDYPAIAGNHWCLGSSKPRLHSPTNRPAECPSETNAIHTAEIAKWIAERIAAGERLFEFLQASRGS